MKLNQFLKSWRVSGAAQIAELFGGLALNGPLSGVSGMALVSGAVTLPLITLAYGVSITPDASAGNLFVVTATNNTAFTINAPTNPPATAGTGQLLTLTIRNASGGALGVATFNAIFKLAAWTQPANAFSRSITFRWDGTNWVEVARTTVDVPN